MALPRQVVITSSHHRPSSSHRLVNRLHLLAEYVLLRGPQNALRSHWTIDAIQPLHIKANQHLNNLAQVCTLGCSCNQVCLRCCLKTARRGKPCLCWLLWALANYCTIPGRVCCCSMRITSQAHAQAALAAAITLIVHCCAFLSMQAYSDGEAQAAFQRMLSHHQRNGW